MPIYDTHFKRSVFANMFNLYLTNTETYKKAGVPKGTGRIAAEVQNKVAALHRVHTDWGKRRLADEMAKTNNWVPLVSPNSVRRILIETEL